MSAEGHAISQAELNRVREAIKGIKDGPRLLQVYMEICAKCGTCAEQCHLSRTDPDTCSNPAFRSDRVRRPYHIDHSMIGKLCALAGMEKRDGLSEEALGEWLRDFYACTCCRRCAKFCPLGIDNSIITRKARSVLLSVGLIPTKLAATQNASEQYGNGEGISPSTFIDMTQFLEGELLEEHGVPIRIPVDQKADVLFVPPSGEILSFPETLMGCATFFHVAGISWTMSSEAFDAANFGFFTGDDQYMKRKNKVLHDACLKLGVKKLVIGECGHAYRVAKLVGGANFWGKIPYEVTSIFVIAADVLRRGGLKLDRDRNPEPVTYHDPCNFARSTGLTEEPRELLRACVREFREMTPNRDMNWCCGGGGGLAVLDGYEGVSKRTMSFHEFRMRRTGQMKLQQIRATGASYTAAPCANCKRQISQLMEYHKENVTVGGVFDLFDKAIVL